MVDVFVILPDQLFYTKEALSIILNDSVGHVYMFEDPLYFTKWRYHASKLALHRASMQRYCKMLRKIAHVHYISLNDITTDWIDYLTQKVSPTSVEMFYPNSMDEWGSKLFKCTFTGLPIKFHESPSFVLSYDYIRSEFGSRAKITFNLFYKQVRKDFFSQLNPRDSKGKYNPLGGVWSFGDETNKPITAGTEIPLLPKLPNNEDFRQACGGIKNIPLRGEIQRYPLDGKEALKWLSHFIDDKLADYGGRQLITIIGPECDLCDNVSKTLFHSALSSSLGIGIITPKQILTELFMAFKRRGIEIPILSFESFFRQLMWREYTRMIYVNAPVTLLELPNYFNARRSINDSFYTGNTQMEPIDMIIKNVIRTGYAHHSQRAYWLGAYMMMQQINPIDIRDWFMSMFVDAYPWSVIPHVLLMHGAVEFGGVLPIRMSNFLINVSNLGKNKVVPWFNKWDLLYYLFIGHNASKLTKSNPKMLKTWKDKSIGERRKILENAKALLASTGDIRPTQTPKVSMRPKQSAKQSAKPPSAKPSSTAKQPSTAKPKTVAKQPTTKQSTAKPLAKQPSAKQPSAKQPSAKQPSAAKQPAKQPSVKRRQKAEPKPKL